MHRKTGSEASCSWYRQCKLGSQVQGWRSAPLLGPWGQAEALLPSDAEGGTGPGDLCFLTLLMRPGAKTGTS